MPQVLTDKGTIDTGQSGLSKAGARKRVGKNKERQRIGEPSPINTKMIKLTTSVHKGHLIAFTYTNTIPQFGGVNSGSWLVREEALVKWGRKNCAKHNGKVTEKVKMFIIAGAIPSSFRGTPQEYRFFGNERFSDYQSKELSINVPLVTWTAACCTFHAVYR